ncbi:hypothetical protein AB1L07_02535 [Niallia alba]|uniref:hypothetical protein n=1 Tax=Niallia alba TaxID=2729105 RepID=UPI0039A3DCF3
MKKTFIEKVAIGIIIFVLIMILVMFSAYVFIGINLFNNPESVGSWFSRLISGFNTK